MESAADATERKIKALLAKGEQDLKEIDEAFILSARGHKVRKQPSFRPEEISLGPVLGIGGFGIVQEITKFTLDCHDEDETEDITPQFDSERPDESNDDHSGHFSMGNDVLESRRLMDRSVLRNGEARYALKRLHGNLSELERARGMVDLALEAKYLSIVWHPSIIKLRGVATGPQIERDFFIVMDRLYDTLLKRMEHWRKTEKNCKGFMLGLGKKRHVLKELLVERMTVAYDLAAALFYLHENRLVYRDIKPENIGFDVRGDVKMFDFGLCKSLSPQLKVKEGYGYRLTGRAGSLPFMAPEICRMEPYDTKCDVFSFAILLWEMLALRPSFKGMDPSDFVERVVIGKEREAVPKVSPPLTKLMLQEAWDDNPRNRPDMKRVAILLRGDLNDMSNDEAVLHRTQHMDDRSNHSYRAEVGTDISKRDALGDLNPFSKMKRRPKSKAMESDTNPVH